MGIDEVEAMFSDVSYEQEIDEVRLLDIYRRSIPPAFDADLLNLQRSIDLKWRQSAYGTQ